MSRWRSAGSAFALVVAMVLPGPALAAEPAGTGTAVHLTGTLRVTVTDDFAGLRTTSRYSLLTDSGTFSLAFAGTAPDGLGGSTVTVDGTRASDGTIDTSAAEVRVVRAAAPLARAQAEPAVTQTLKIGVVLADFSDQSGYPVTTTQAGDAFNTNAASVRSYFQTASRGRVTTTATILGPWTLGITACQAANTLDYLEPAVQSAASSHGVSLSGYDHIVVWTKAPCGVQYVGLGETPGTWVHVIMDYAVYPDDEPASSAIVASHELGHNLGLQHANALACYDGSGNQVALSTDCENKEYYDLFSTMGIAGPPDHSLMDAEHLRELGWLTTSESQTVTAAGTYSLVPVYSSAAGVRELRMARSSIGYGFGDGYWTFEIRSTLAGSAFDQFTNYGDAATTGVTIRFSESGTYFGASNPTYLVDTWPTSSRGNIQLAHFWDAPLQPGETFADPGLGVSFTVLSASSSGAQLKVIDTQAPGAVPYLNATPANGTIALGWGAATDNLKIASYRIIRDGTTIANVGASTYTFTDATALGGHTYGYQVRAVDGSGNLGAAASATATLPNTPPGAPTAVSALPGNGAAQVSWTTPSFTGGTISRYTVTSSPDGRTCTTTGATSCVVTGLTNGTSYTFTVVATNSSGPGATSAPSNAVTPTTLPGPPTGTAAIASDGSAAVTWSAPASNGGSAIAGYTVTASPGGRTCTTTGATYCTVTGLTNGTAYNFTVRARNATGLGLPSAPSFAVTPLTGATYVALTPNRIVDSRSGTRLGLSASLRDRVPATFQVTGRSTDATKNVPTSAVAVTGNLTVTNQTSKGYLSLTAVAPAVGATPSVSTLNFPKGDNRANGVLVLLGAGGKLSVTFAGDSGATADVVFDVTGYFRPGH